MSKQETITKYIARSTAIFFSLIFSVFAGSTFLYVPYFAEANATDNVSGYAWSSTIGWISFNNCTTPSSCGAIDYGVTVNAATGDFSGYAWSSNVGWIDFGPSSGYPEAPNQGARLLSDGTTITGWARVTGAPSGNWDGWIKLSGTAPNYGVTFNPVSKELQGFAWGSDVVGWVSFNCESDSACSVATADHAVKYVGLPTLSFSAIPVSPIGYNTATLLVWTSENADYCTASGDWNGSKDKDGGSESTGLLTSSKTYSLQCFDSTGTLSSPLKTISMNVLPPACANVDGVGNPLDDDSDGRANDLDPGCHSDYDPTNPLSYVFSDNNESDEPACMNNKDDDDDGYTDATDPGCWFDSTDATTYNALDDEENNCGNDICEDVESFGKCPADCFFNFINF